MPPPEAVLDLPQCRDLFRTVLTAEHGSVASETRALLDLLLSQLEILRDLANGYPNAPITGDVWFDGKELAELCDELTATLANHELPKERELASRLAVGMALQVMSHYPEEIFPRIIRNAECRELLGQEAHAISAYGAILSDFERLELVELLGDEEELSPSGRAILSAASRAATRLAELRPERGATLLAFNSLLAQRLAQSLPQETE